MSAFIHGRCLSRTPAASGKEYSPSESACAAGFPEIFRRSIAAGMPQEDMAAWVETLDLPLAAAGA